MLDAGLQRIWYRGSPSAFLLLPLSLLFLLASSLRRALFRFGLFKSSRVSCPVVVVGNITVGGTGKTPLVIWLANELAARGFAPGVITRGYGGNSATWPRDVTALSNPAEVGDESVLIAKSTQAVVVAGAERVLAAERAIELGATVIICDDGLQHYRLRREIEIAVVDAERLFGNGFLLPAGPLRELPNRLNKVDAIVLNRRQRETDATVICKGVLQVNMKTTLGKVSAITTTEVRSLDSFRGQEVHALAGIGHPDSFFNALESAGLQVLDKRTLPDHAVLTAADLSFDDSRPVLMTEKDAVKCRPFADARCWAVSLKVELDHGSDLLASIAHKLDSTR